MHGFLLCWALADQQENEVRTDRVMVRDEAMPVTKSDLHIAQCPVPAGPDLAGVTVVRLQPQPPLADYLAAMAAADREARQRLGSYMLLSWYDRDRDFESPQHVSECHQDSAVPGYVDYALHRGARLMVDVEQGRFVFFYLPVDI
jgi:hypothetical protein